ncbi:RNA 2',3'-cyclic phosphodiesterase [Thalassovita sp.]|jgi:2'-5' RNA ligase|uniref:RNA 2',3'-cyclic phosphodiesterase n=1 Tax=Thalassovita sp. TaxID=1979401 RepID=UPI003B5B05CD
MRLFIALDPPEGLRDALMDMQDGLGLGREVPPENLHVTLAFLGDQPEASAELLHEMLGAIRAPAVRLTLRGAEMFGGRQPRAAVALVEKVPELVALQEKVVQAARMAGIELPRRRFKPHFTLMRLPRFLPDFAEHRIAAWLGRNGDLVYAGGDALQFTLYRSTLHGDGPIYDALAQYPLAPTEEPA